MEPTEDTIPARLQVAMLNRHLAVVDTAFARQLASRHERTFEVTLRPEERLISEVVDPNSGERARLGGDGIIEVGEPVGPSTVLVGIEAPRPGGGGPKSSEELLLDALFGANADTVDRSLRAPLEFSGHVTSVKQNSGRVEVTVGWERPLVVGDIISINGARVRVGEIRALDADIAWGRPGTASVAKRVSAIETLHARSIGPYDRYAVRQPLEPKEHNGGQLLDPMTLAVLADVAPWLAWEAATIRSDDVEGRVDLYVSLVKGENPVLPRAPRLDAVEVTAAYLFALGVVVDFAADELRPEPLSDSDVLERSVAQLQSPALWDEDREPVPGGPRCQRWFGPVRDYTCACPGQPEKYRGTVCDDCGVEVISSTVRRERFGHIDLGFDCPHPELDATIRHLPVLPPALRHANIDHAYARIVGLAAENADDASTRRSIAQTVAELFGLLAETVPHYWACASAKVVDYSGIAHLVADATLEPGWCRVPRDVARTLFRPMIYEALERRGAARRIKQAKQLVEDRAPVAEQCLYEVGHGYPVLLAAGRQILSRRVSLWDHPAVAVDDETEPRIRAETVQLHLPVTWQGAMEASELSDFPAPPSWPERGWLAQAIGQPSVAASAFDAVKSATVDPLVEPLLRAILGRRPAMPTEARLDAWARSEERRRTENLGAASSSDDPA